MTTTSPAEPAVATAAASAIRNHAVTSSIAAQASASAADRTLQHPALDEDAREHREGRDRHRHPHEEREREEVVVRADELVERQRDREAEHHRQGDARVRDRRGLGHPAAQLLGVELEADQEHVEDQPEVRDDADQGDDVGREDRRLQLGRQRAEEASGRAGSRRPPRPSPAAARSSPRAAPASRAASITNATATKNAASVLGNSRCLVAVMRSCGPVCGSIVRCSSRFCACAGSLCGAAGLARRRRRRAGRRDRSPCRRRARLP